MVYPATMSAPSRTVPQKDAPPPDAAPADSRAERLAAALRENLRRRKAQARARRESDPVPVADRPIRPDR